MHFNDFVLEPIKKICFKVLFRKNQKWYNGVNVKLTPDIDAYQIFIDKINSPLPLMVARYGSTELTCILAYLFSNSKESYLLKVTNYLKGEIPQFWFGNKNRKEICKNSGFFPDNKSLIIQFCEKMLDNTKETDILLSWLNGEKYIHPHLSKNCKIISLWSIEPFFQTNPWTMCLEGKKVLVIHPYAKTIAKQYSNRHNIFPVKQILPEMDLITYKAVQTISNNKSTFTTWFDALEFMEKDIQKLDFDIALIGAGAYGLPLAAYIKNMGKKAIHIGGSLQLYFGITGLRWEQMSHFKAMFNDYWVKPLPEEYPNDYKKN